ncbi:SseB family protein [Nocardioides marmoribigeumensis]|uniref:SseB protein N-terminal domain-containing protein n=1 Tax=Nocardioides marmoribigeumensis TaxID=433649 RepID=A0ABU2BQQ7_9ACTN|nr:SseB family protein [Nocardioides marmoribigeumensis]MDR7360968.1 hypothetical protein [Nocardioides marmoribigeumensis]
MTEPPSARRLLDTGFGDDDGTASQAVSDALTAYDADPDGLHRETLAVLQDARLLVPVVAVLGEVELGEDGLARDKTSDMATVLMRGPGGRTALLAFTSMAALQAWRPDARPVPVSVTAAAEAARVDGADTLLVDVAGPVRFVVQDEDLQALAEGYRLADLAGRLAWTKVVDPG